MQITGEINDPGGADHGRPKTLALNPDGSLQIGAQGAVGSAQQSPSAAPAGVDSALLKSGAGQLRRLKVTFLGTGAEHVQIHDTAGAPTDATMLDGGGYPVDDAEPILIIEWPTPLAFDDGITIALSSTRDTYTQSAQTMIVAAQWS